MIYLILLNALFHIIDNYKRAIVSSVLSFNAIMYNVRIASKVILPARPSAEMDP